MMTDDGRAAVRPAEIEVDPEAGLLRILWQDGHESIYGLPALRPRCPCAVCQGEMGMPGVVDAATEFTKEQTTLVDIQEIGRYAVQPIWADGHQTGYYTFTLLRSLCPCDACVAARGNGTLGAER
jgi:DUF971 family protein